MRVGAIVRYHPDSLPSSTFCGSLRVCSSRVPAALFHAADAPGVFALQSLFLFASSTRLVVWKSRLDVFSTLDRPNASPRVSASVQFDHPGRECCIRTQTAALMGLLPPSRHSGFPSCCHLSVVPPLLAFASDPFQLISEVGLQRFSLGTPGISRSRERQPSWCFWPSSLLTNQGEG
jgi:hypothetical protein